MGEWRKYTADSSILFIHYKMLGRSVKNGEACINMNKILVRKHEVRQPLGRLRRGCDNNVDTCGSLTGCHVVQDIPLV
jgi:hypothetical protein